MACALLKEIQRFFDPDGIRGSLHYLKTKEGKEIDFLIQLEDHSPWLIEAKLNDHEHRHRTFDISKAIFKTLTVFNWLVTLAKKKRQRTGIRITKAASWLSRIQLAKSP